MLRPEIATLRPIFTAFSIILCTLWTLDEKVAIIILELEVLKIFSMVCPTTFSEAVYPGPVSYTHLDVYKRQILAYRL